MSMNNKQRWMGGVVLLGGGILLAALLLKGNHEIKQDQQPAAAYSTQKNTSDTQGNEKVSLQPLSVDVATEKRLLDEQRRAREKAVAEQEARAAEFLKRQQEAEAEAARKAAEEYAAINARRAAMQESSDNLPPELIEDKKTKAKNLAEEKHKVEAEKKAAEDKRKAEADKKAAEDTKKKAETEQARKLMDGDSNWMVQVALAVNQANADAVVSKLRAKGYKVTTSKTSKGIRIMVGPAKDRDTADATRKKIAADDSLNMKSAWVIDWVPLDQR